MEQPTYPSLFLRIKAAFIDAVLIMMLLYTATIIFSKFETVNDIAKMIVFVFIFVLYEPLMVSFLGASLGHLFCDLKVEKDDNSSENLSLPTAMFRFVIKSGLGWLSLLSIASSSKKRAIHDVMSKSIVVYVGKTAY